MKIIAWNVNGLRSLLKTQYLNEMVKNYKPDVLCIGETKLSCPFDSIEMEIKEKLDYESLPTKKIIRESNDKTLIINWYEKMHKDTI